MIKFIRLLTCFFVFYISTAFTNNVWAIHAGSALAATGGHGDVDGVKPEQSLRLITIK
jgi:hypothetical protein